MDVLDRIDLLANLDVTRVVDAVDVGSRDVNVGIEVLATTRKLENATGAQAVELDGQLDGLIEVDSSSAVKNDVDLGFAEGDRLRAQTKLVERNVSFNDLYMTNSEANSGEKVSQSCLGGQAKIPRVNQ